MLTAKPVFANIAFFRIADFDGRPVAVQAHLKEGLEDRVRAAIAELPAAERIVLDAADGIALVILGEPARALDIAQSLRTGTGNERLQVGVNHGPVAITARDAGAMVFGDGLGGAAAAAGFATDGRLLVTVPFAKMLEATRPDRAYELVPAGEFTDARVRLHAFYTPEPQRLLARRNRFAAYALAGMLGILLLGIVARQVNVRYFPPRPAIVEFIVKPHGYVVVDGIAHGRAPPLRDLELSPGRHHVQVRNGGYPPLDFRVNLEPGERMTVTHSFAGEREMAKPGGFWRDLRRNLGF